MSNRPAAYARLLLLGGALLFIAPRAFPCEPVYSGLRQVVSAWEELRNGTEPRIGPSPVFFARTVDDLPLTLTRDGAEVAMEYTPLRQSELVEDGTLAFVPRMPLAPGNYCYGFDCLDVGATFDNSPVTMTTSIEGIERREYSDGCFGVSDCGSGVNPRRVNVTVRLSPEDASRVATFRIVVGQSPGSAYPLARLLGRSYYRNSGYEVLEIVNGRYDIPVDLEYFKRLCVSVQPVLWDATVSPVVDAGCVEF